MFRKPTSARMGRLRRGVVSLLLAVITLTPLVGVFSDIPVAKAAHPADEFLATLPDTTAQLAAQDLRAIAAGVSQTIRNYPYACGTDGGINFQQLYAQVQQGKPLWSARQIDCLINAVRVGYYENSETSSQAAYLRGYAQGIARLLELRVDKELYDNPDTRSQSRLFKEGENGSIGFTEAGTVVWTNYLNARATVSTRFAAVYMALFMLQKANQMDAAGFAKNANLDPTGSAIDPSNGEVLMQGSHPDRYITLYPINWDSSNGLTNGWSERITGCEGGVRHGLYIDDCDVGRSSRTFKYYADTYANPSGGNYQAQDSEGRDVDVHVIKFRTQLTMGGWDNEASPYTAPGGKTIHGLGQAEFEEFLSNKQVPGLAQVQDKSAAREGTNFAYKSGYFDPYFNFTIEDPGSGGEEIAEIAQLAKDAGLSMQGTPNLTEDPDPPSESDGRCGRSTNIFTDGLELKLAETACHVTVMIQDFAISMMVFSFDFLGASANIEALKGPSASGIAAELTTNPQDVIIATSDGEGSGTEGALATAGGIIRRANSLVLSLLNSAVVLFLILVAIFNILQINVNTYAIKKVLPGLIIGFILAQFSVFFIRGALEVAGNLTGSLLTTELAVGEDGTNPQRIGQVIETVGSYGGNRNVKLTTGDEADMGKVGQQFVLNGFLLVGTVMVFILAFLFLVRNIIMYFLTPLGPVAVFGKFFPPLNKLSNRWFGLFVNWLFMPLVASFWLWLGFVWMTATNIPENPGTFDMLTPTFLQYFVAYCFAMVCFFFAMRTPFTLAGEAKNVVATWNKAGKASYNYMTDTPKSKIKQRWYASTPGQYWNRLATTQERNKKDETFAKENQVTKWEAKSLAKSTEKSSAKYSKELARIERELKNGLMTALEAKKARDKAHSDFIVEAMADVRGMNRLSPKRIVLIRSLKRAQRRGDWEKSRAADAAGFDENNQPTGQGTP